MSILHFYFGWPDGAVWGNLIASVICVGTAWWRLRVQAVAHHLEQLAQAERHHLALREHVTASVPVPAARRPETLAAKPGKEAGT